VELAFLTGDIIKVFGDMDDDGFYMGEIEGIRGLVPSNFLTDAPAEYSSGGGGGPGREELLRRGQDFSSRNRAAPRPGGGRGQQPPPPHSLQRDSNQLNPGGRGALIGKGI